MKTFLIIVGLLALALLAKCVADARKPELLAHVDVTATTLRLTNGNDRSWPAAKVILNDAFDGPRTTVPPVAAGATVDIPLADFIGLLNKQRFNPEFQRVEVVTIDANGFQLGVFQTRRR